MNWCKKVFDALIFDDINIVKWFKNPINRYGFFCAFFGATVAIGLIAIMESKYIILVSVIISGSLIFRDCCRSRFKIMTKPDVMGIKQ